VVRLRLARAALRLEERRRTEGRYPLDASAVDLPADPLALSAKLRYQPSADGTGYKLWSVGVDHTDDNGQAEAEKDIVLERPTMLAPR
jgi:hypothetical protein